MAHRQPPSFFKILLDPSAPQLPLPPDFVTKHLENKRLKDLTVRSAKGGYSWRVKIKKIGESLCLSDGWESVVRDIELGFGDFLVFRVVDKSVYKMIVYSPNGCEKDFPKKNQVDDNSGVVEEQEEEDDEDEDEDVVVVEDDGVDDDDVVVEDDDDDVVVEEEEEEEVEDEYEDEDEDYEDEDEDEDEVGYEEKEDDDDDDEDDGDGDGEDGGGDIDGNDGDPFFMVNISKSHKNFMRLPPDFVELAGMEGEGTLTGVNVDGKEWQLGLRVEKYFKKETYCISAGWPDFRRSNDICEGDECVFKFIRKEDKLLLARVSKNRREKSANGVAKRKREQAARNSGEVPTMANGVKKRKREQPVRNAVKVPAKPNGVGNRKKEQPVRRNSGKVPARNVKTKAARGGGKVARGKERVKGVRPPGRPAKRLRGRPAKPK